MVEPPENEGAVITVSLTYKSALPPPLKSHDAIMCTQFAMADV